LRLDLSAQVLYNKSYLTMQLVFSFFVLVNMIVMGLGARLAGECAMMCNDLRTEVLTLSMCRDAKRTLPRPKVGDFCSTAMEQGFSDACVALCMEQQPVGRVAQTCRAAAIEMPRPTVRKWCEHGYNVAFKKTVDDLRTHFKSDAEPVLEVFTAPEVPIVANSPRVDTHETHRHMPKTEDTDSSSTGGLRGRSGEGEGDERAVVAIIPITMDDVTHDLIVYEGQNAEEAVVVFCRQHSAEDVSTCIRHLLTVVVDQLEEMKTSGV